MKVKDFSKMLKDMDVVSEEKDVRYICSGYFVDGQNQNIKKFKKMLEDLISNYGKIISNSAIVGETIVEVQFVFRNYSDEAELKFEKEFANLGRSLANKYTSYKM